MLSPEDKKKLLDAGYTDIQVRAYETLKSKPTTKKPSVTEDIKGAFKSSVDYAKQGLAEGAQTRNPIKMTESGLKTVAGAIGAAFSPLAPVTKYVGKGIEKVADTVSESPMVQKFAMSKAGQTTARVAEDVQNVSTGLGVIAGGSKATPGAVAQNTLKPKANVVAPTVPKQTVGGYIKSTVRDVVPTKQGAINELVTKGLDLSPGDLANISKSTGNDIGTWISDNNLIGKNKNETQGNINNFYKKNYDSVRNQIDSVPVTYTQPQIPRFVDALKQIQSQVKNVPGLEEASAEVQNLLIKKQLRLSDVQRAKELIDDHYALYNKVGDVAGGVQKEGIANIRKELRKFIEDEVEKNTGADIRAMNNNVMTARAIEDAIITRAPKGLTRANIKIGDLGIFGFGSFAGGPLTGLALLFGKKLLETPTVRLRIARMIDKMSDAQKMRIQQELQSGIIPQEFAPFVKQKNMLGKATRQIGPAIGSQSIEESQ